MRSLRLPLILFSLALSGCGGHADGYDRALAYERQILQDDPEAGYDDPRYIVVLRELRSVPLSHADHGRAEAWSRRISDARRIHLRDTWDAVDHVPDRLVGLPAPRPGERAVSEAQPASKRRTSKPTSADLAKLDITLYSAPWCGYCKQARAWLDARGYPYVDKDVEQDPQAAREARSKSRRGGVPVIDVNGRVVQGFDVPALEAAIEAALTAP